MNISGVKGTGVKGTRYDTDMVMVQRCVRKKDDCNMVKSSSTCCVIFSQKRKQSTQQTPADVCVCVCPGEAEPTRPLTPTKSSPSLSSIAQLAATGVGK